jgi:hypothetical protein
VPWLVLLTTLCVPYAQGQQSADPNADPAPQTNTPDAPTPAAAPSTSTSITVTAAPGAVPEQLIRAEGEREVKTEETQRIAVVVPNFYTVIDGEGVPLDKAQKIQLAWRATIDPFNVVGAFVLGGLSEVQGTHRGFGWGPSGYFKRAGANLADVSDATMLSGAVYPILLHQDPRFFRQGTGSTGSRLRHALLAPYVCRGDDERPQPNFSNLLGNFTAGAISNAYYPRGDRGAALTVENFSIVLVEGSLGNIALEFSPDVQAWWKRHRNKR